MILQILLVFLCALAPNPTVEAGVRISILSLLRPEEVSLECAAELGISGAGIASTETKLLKGERLIIEAEGESLLLTVFSADNVEVDLGTCDICRIEGSIASAPLRIDSLSPSEFTRRVVGKLSVRARAGRLVIILTAPLEQVVGEVVAAEVGAACPPESAAAVAVAVRSYIVATKGQFEGDGFDMLDSTQSLLYRGRDGAFGPDSKESLSLGETAAHGTTSIVLVHNDRPVPAYFHACCGGETATPAMVWGATEFNDCFEPIECSYCSASKKFSWKREASLADVLKALDLRQGNVPPEFSIAMFDGSGYTQSLEVIRAGETHTFSAERFRLLIGRALGWNIVRSNRFSIELDGDMVRFEGTGFGHGVGLCQEGASEAARRGLSWRQILRHYYPRCDIRSMVLEKLETIDAKCFSIY